MSVTPAFQPELQTVPITSIVPLKTVTPAFRKTDVYWRIAASLEHVGLIEPLVVFPTPKAQFLLLDGNTRYDILKAIGTTTVKCLLSTDNESYTYNRRVNYIPPIAQHHMILRALAHVSEERIAKALNVSVSAIRTKRDLLKGICPEVAELLRNERVSGDAFTALRKMKPVRQIEVARFMLNAKKYSGRFVRALLGTTAEELLVATPTKRQRDIPADKQALMEQETNAMLKHADSIRANYGNDVLDLTATSRYVERLLANNRIQRYLTKNHDEIRAALRQLLDDIEKERTQPATPGRVNGIPEHPSIIAPRQPLQ